MSLLTELEFWALGFYKDVAPTALTANRNAVAAFSPALTRSGYAGWDGK